MKELPEKRTGILREVRVERQLKEGGFHGKAVSAHFQ
jgi:hypothetical protein